MAEATASRLNRLQLSAADLKSITREIKPGEPWPDALVEDYLNILRDLVLLADEIDQNAGEILSSINRAFSSIAANRSMSAQSRAKVNALKVQLAQLNARVDGIDTEITGLFDFFPVKACSFAVTGNGTSDPAIVHSYNVDSISRIAVGTYEVELSQGTINGQNIADYATYSKDWLIVPSLNTEVFEVLVIAFAGTTLQFTVSEMTAGAGGDLSLATYDLTSSDRLNFNILMNAGGGTLPPA